MEQLIDRLDAVRAPDSLRGVMRDDGVILLRGVLDVQAVEALRATIGGVLHRSGWVTDPVTLEATDAVRPPGDQGFGPVYREIQASEAVHRFVFDSPLPDIIRGLFAEDVFVHPGKVVRVMPPDRHGEFRTRPHQDFAVLQTTADTITCWTPLAPCPPTRGGLIVRPGSHRAGYLAPDGSGFGPYPVFLSVDDDEPGWATATFEPGDVVLFHGLTVHASLPNETALCRLSMEFRFQAVSDPIMAATLRPNRPAEVPDWDVLTKGWSSTRWIEVPDQVEVVRPPRGTRFDDLLRELTVPPSRFDELSRS